MSFVHKRRSLVEELREVDASTYHSFSNKASLEVQEVPETEESDITVLSSALKEFRAVSSSPYTGYYMDMVGIMATDRMSTEKTKSAAGRLLSQSHYASAFASASALARSSNDWSSDQDPTVRNMVSVLSVPAPTPSPLYAPTPTATRFDGGSITSMESFTNKSTHKSGSLSNHLHKHQSVGSSFKNGGGSGSSGVGGTGAVQVYLSSEDMYLRSSIRGREYREVLALQLRSRAEERQLSALFKAWRAYAFRFYYLRKQMIQCFKLRNISLIFHSWRTTSRRDKLLRRCLKRHWKRHRRDCFKWWKLIARWQSLKIGLLRRCFMSLANSNRAKNVVFRNWASWTQRVLERFHCLKIQRSYRAYLYKREYWAFKKIKIFVLKKCMRKVYLARKANEKIRMKDEEIVYNAVNQRAKKFLKDKLDEESGAELLKKYLIDVDAAVKREKEGGPRVFPTREENSEVARMFTIRAKAMSVLSQKSDMDIIRLSREKFRRTSPPPYYCSDCMTVFLTGELSRLHYVLGCSHSTGMHKVRSWVLAEKITDIALERLATNFFRRPPRGKGKDKDKDKDKKNFKALRHDPQGLGALAL